jgi:wyosine [tRNA(Phe)-imidazoG37] synthetase (radical SAM superfamily)
VSERQHHVFGPVPSRRLGRSLGIDLVPYKTCTFDCLYCQLGATTRLTVERGAFVSPDGVLRELAERLATTTTPDYITLSGSGEPTLQRGLGELIAGIRRLTDRPIAVLTNGSLLWREELRAELREADLVIPSLDAGDEEHFRLVNRPHAEITLARIVEGLARFREEFGGQLWLEVFLLAGLTTDVQQVRMIGALADRIAPDRIQLNTVARPPTDPRARAASTAELAQAAALLGPRATVIAECAAAAAPQAAPAQADDEVLGLLQRRPCTLADLALGLGVHRLEVAKRVERLLRAGAIAMRQHHGLIYYTSTDAGPVGGVAGAAPKGRA